MCINLTHNIYVQEPLMMTLALKHVGINYQTDFVLFLNCACTDLVNLHKVNFFRYPGHVVTEEEILLTRSSL